MESPTPFETDTLSGRVIGAAIEVRKTIGPGLIESIYENALAYELSLRGLRFQRQVCIDVFYKGQIIKGQRIDLIVEDEIILGVEVGLSGSRSGFRPDPVVSEVHRTQTRPDHQFW